MDRHPLLTLLVLWLAVSLMVLVRVVIRGGRRLPAVDDPLADSQVRGRVDAAWE
jgi:hypothetical protein